MTLYNKMSKDSQQGEVNYPRLHPGNSPALRSRSPPPHPRASAISLTWPARSCTGQLADQSTAISVDCKGKPAKLLSKT